MRSSFATAGKRNPLAPGGLRIMGLRQRKEASRDMAGMDMDGWACCVRCLVCSYIGLGVIDCTMHTEHGRESDWINGITGGAKGAVLI